MDDYCGQYFFIILFKGQGYTLKWYITIENLNLKCLLNLTFDKSVLHVLDKDFKSSFCLVGRRFKLQNIIYDMLNTS